MIPDTGVPFTLFDDLIAPIDGDVVGFVGVNTDTGIRGIYRTTAGGLETVYDNTLVLPDGTPMDLVGAPRMRDSHFAFFASNATLTAGGFYTDASGTLQTIANLNTPIPRAGGTFLTWVLVFSFDGRHVVFKGIYESGGSGVFTDRTGELTAVVLRGDRIAGRIVDGVWIDTESLDDNKIIMQVSFEDFSDAIVLARYPAPPGDVDDNGRVDLRDVARFQSCFGAVIPYPDTVGCARSDFNGDRIVDLRDHQRFNECADGPSLRSSCAH